MFVPKAVLGLVLAVGCGLGVAAAPGGALAAVAPLSARTTSLGSLAPSPDFLVPGICGVAGPNYSTRCFGTILRAVDDARRIEHLGPVSSSFSVARLERLTPAEQV